MGFRKREGDGVRDRGCEMQMEKQRIRAINVK